MQGVPLAVNGIELSKRFELGITSTLYRSYYGCSKICKSYDGQTEAGKRAKDSIFRLLSPSPYEGKPWLERSY